MIVRPLEAVLNTVTVRELLSTGLLTSLVLAVSVLAFFGVGFAAGERLPFAHDHFGSDTWHQNLPFRAFYHRELARGNLPLWCPSFGTGYPLFAEGQVGALYPPNLVLHGLLPFTVAYNLSILLSMVLAGTFAAMFARQLGAGRCGALFAGLVFGLSGWYLMHLKHVNYTAAAAWAPLLLLLLERISAGAGLRTTAVLSLAIGAMHFAGCPQITYYNLLLGSLYAVMLGLRRGSWSRRLRTPLAWSGAVLIGFLLAAPQLLPSLELKGVGPRHGGLTLEEASFTAMAPRHLILFLAPKALGDHADLREREVTNPATGQPVRVIEGFETDRPDGAFSWEVTGYVGILPLLLAGAAIVLAWRMRSVAWCAVLLVLALLLALGTSGGVVPILFRIIPGFDWFRVFGRFLVYADLMLALLAGLGLTRLHALLPARNRNVVGVLSTGAAALIFLADMGWSLGNQNSTVPAEHWMSPPATVRTIRAREGDRPEPFRIATIDPTRQVHRNAHVRARGWTANFEHYEPVRLCVAPNMGILYGLSTALVYTPLPLPWVRDTMVLLPYDPDPRSALPQGHRPKVSALLNVRYVIDPFGTAGGDLPVLAEYPGDILHRGPLPSRSGTPYRIRLLEDPDTLPRAFLVGGGRIVPDPPAASAGGRSLAQCVVLDPTWDPRREVLITEEEPAPVEGRAEPVRGSVRFVENGTTRVVLETESDREAWLFLGDSWYPGWKARVDGQPVDIRRANIYGRAVRVPAGRHTIVFEYRCRGLESGIALSGVSVLLLAGLFAPGLIRRRRPGQGERSSTP